MIGTVAWTAAALVLLAAAVLKAADRTATTVALSGHGVPGGLTGPAWAGAIAAEAGLAAALAAGLAWAPAAATALLAGFAVLQAVALARGGSGAPCGCFGARGRLSPGALGRTALLAAACAALPALGDPAQPPLALTAALAAGAVALALGRPGAAPSAALEIDGEGPPLGAASPVVVAGEGIRLALFTAEGCRLCRRVRAAADLFAAHGVPVGRFDERADAPAWAAAAVPGAPYAVAIGPDGTVLAKGTVNAASQLESVLAAGEQRWATSAAGSDAGDAGVRERAALGADDVGRASSAATSPRSAAGSSRRGFLARAGGIAASLTGAGALGGMVRPGDAQAHHFCGHIYTTDGCPHPTGLPRIDRDGFPLRAEDGRPVDDLGRVIDRLGRPLGEDGVVLADPEGRPLPLAPRTRVCAATARDYAITTQIDGAWYRCCDGHVRKLIDCCSDSRRRINGDGALRGYCYQDRKVFCVMYFQTSVPC